MFMNISDFVQQAFANHMATAEATAKSMPEPLARWVSACTTSITNGGKILFLGNGGSAADAQHLATELVVRYKDDRAPIAAIALTTDTSMITAAGNDIGYDNVFARQVAALAKVGDVVVGISTSGNSENVVRAMTAAAEVGAVRVALTGEGGGKLAKNSDILLAVPDKVTARIQEMHILLGHLLCEALEQELELVTMPQKIGGGSA
jgi:D-sedoheptulose 7-phosphate isomerase